MRQLQQPTIGIFESHLSVARLFGKMVLFSGLPLVLHTSHIPSATSMSLELMVKLRRAGSPVPLSPFSFEIIIYLNVESAAFINGTNLQQRRGRVIFANWLG
jgi:hypothetical protein